VSPVMLKIGIYAIKSILEHSGLSCTSNLWQTRYSSFSHPYTCWSTHAIIQKLLLSALV